MEEGSGFLDGFSPVSPASSEGSTDTILSSGASDLETSPRRGSSSPLKKTRYLSLLKYLMEHFFALKYLSFGDEVS